ncbi:MAG: DUF4124 domain-containing protein [Burkholderiaceae bacterium]
MKPFRLQPLIAATAFAVCTLAGAAGAQYVWVDGNGVRQYSDMPPPASVPTASILKAPNWTPSTQAAPDPAPDGTTAEKKAPPTLAERNADFVKRRSEKAEQDKKAAEQARIAAQKAQSCERARQYQKTLESGVRLASTDKNGERVYLDDAARAKEQQATREVLKECGA